MSIARLAARLRRRKRQPRHRKDDWKPFYTTQINPIP